MSDAEVMSTAIVAALYFGGNLERARGLLAQPTYIPRMLSKSRFNRRLHALEGLVMREAAGINFSPMRKKNSTRPVPAYIAYLQARGRKMVETAGSLVARLLPK